MATPNANRVRGGVSYYCIQSSNQNFLCWKIDEQIQHHLQAVQVDPELIPTIRKIYQTDVTHYTSDRSREIKSLQQAMKKIEEKELNLWRAFTEHGMRPQIYETLSHEYEDERQRIEQALVLITKDHGQVVDNLDAALMVISQIADRYPKNTKYQQRDILKQMVNRIVINPEGRIIRIELKPPFNYLDDLIKGSTNDQRGGETSLEMKRTSTLSKHTGSLQVTSGAPSMKQIEPSFPTANFLDKINFPQRVYLERLSDQVQ